MADKVADIVSDAEIDRVQPAEWAMTKAAQICQQIHCMNTDACLTIARALEAADKAATERERTAIPQSTIKLVSDYNHVHFMMDDGKEWHVARKYLVTNGWSLTTETYEYWLEFTSQKMILALEEIVAAAIRKGAEQ